MIDIFTGQPAVVLAVKVDNLSALETDELVDLLNHRDLKRRGLLKRSDEDT
jgi:hypothetical protein